MKYVVADANGRILKDDAVRTSEAINWARSRIKGSTSVRKAPEIIKVVGASPEQEMFITDVDTARSNGWKPMEQAA